LNVFYSFDKIEKELIMGTAYADIMLVNATDASLARRRKIKESDIRKVPVRALVDTGSELLTINEEIQNKLGLLELRKQTVELADGSIHNLPITEGIEVYFENRDTLCSAVVMPGDSEVLLGAIPIEGMDVVIDLKNRRLMVNPAHPDEKLIKIKRGRHW